MSEVTLIATTRMGIEKMVRLELQDLGFESIRVSEGRVEFDGRLADIPKVNLWLRCAERVQLKMGAFRAETFDELYEQTKAIPWETMIPADGHFPVLGKSVKSQLGSIRACQSIVKKAIVDRLHDAYRVDELFETGATYTVQVALFKDDAILTIDTSGDGLHKRGYRALAGGAPLKETLAATLVKLSFWNPDRLLIDPMCGSGTILIEAALIARNIAPGLKRSFVSETWAQLPAELWEQERLAAAKAINPEKELELFGYDLDPENVAIAKENAELAGVGGDITFAQKDVKELWIDQQFGIMITNPPYGKRLSEFQEMNEIYISLHKTFRKKKGWSVYVFTADRIFPKYFKRARPDRVRKLYNGNIEANYYQYYGDRPPKKLPIADDQ